MQHAVVACCPCHLSHILESRRRPLGAARSHGPVGGSALARRAEPSCPSMRCRPLQGGETALRQATEFRYLQNCPESSLPNPGEAQWLGVRLGQLPAPPWDLLLCAEWCACMFAGWGIRRDQALSPPSFPIPLLVWTLVTVSSCPVSPCLLQGRCLGRRAVGALPPMPGAGLELGTTSTYHAFEVQPSTGRLFHSRKMPRGSANHNKHHIVLCVCVGGDSHLFSEPPRPGLMHHSAPDLQWP